MDKIKMEDFIKILCTDVCCIEMNFSVNNDKDYEDCWIGKLCNEDGVGKELYWYGLVPDGSQAYDYDSIDDILNAKVFNGKSICDIWESVIWHSLDGCSIDEMLPTYLNYGT